MNLPYHRVLCNREVETTVGGERIAWIKAERMAKKANRPAKVWQLLTPSNPELPTESTYLGYVKPNGEKVFY
jgi:hypothetical protein